MCLCVLFVPDAVDDVHYLQIEKNSEFIQISELWAPLYCTVNNGFLVLSFKELATGVEILGRRNGNYNVLASQMFTLYRLFMLTVISGELRPVKRNSGFS